MLSVCRLCARWAERVLGIDVLLLNNLQHAKEAIKQMFHLDLLCPPSYPNQVCLECVQYLEHSYVFHQQLLNAEKVFLALQERGELIQRLSEMKNAGDALQFEEMVEEESGSEALQTDADELVGKDREMDVTADEENSSSAKPSERVIEIKIEAIEELEIISCPLATDGIVNEQSSREKIADDEENENYSPDMERHQTQRATKKVNELRREPMTVKLPPEQKTNHTVVRNKCYVCYKTYGTEAELMSHLIKHHDLLPYRCQQCSTPNCAYEFRTNQALNKHLETHWYPYECAECQLRFSKKERIEDHLRTVHGSDKWHTCKRCGLKIQELRKYRLHVIAHRNMESTQYHTVTNLHDRQQGLQHKHVRRIFQCPYCGRHFKHSITYELHKTQHLQTKPLYQCTEAWCRERFTSFREWRRHMKAHFPNKSVYLKRARTLPESHRDPSSYPKACPGPDCYYVAPALPPMLAHFSVHSVRPSTCRSVPWNSAA
ncbi:zinc finger protein 14 homolog [Anopheles marshallii]|uniref:zinc finger protein 14 homolog n=1 Tax=Anopheles marshallii TaxID=1521116 RepID=UPI00237AB36F|nr:zinc finger protein 14 homolog [Anopheles marshallii]